MKVLRQGRRPFLLISKALGDKDILEGVLRPSLTLSLVHNHGSIRKPKEEGEAPLPHRSPDGSRGHSSREGEVGTIWGTLVASSLVAGGVGSGQVVGSVCSYLDNCFENLRNVSVAAGQAFAT